MRVFTKRVLALAASLAVVTVGVTAGAPSSVARGDSVPDDGAASGHIGFCDQDNRQVRSGILDAAPFAWKAVASTSAPAGYGRGKAVLVAFQPRQDVDPGDWTGKQLTGASIFSSAAHPMVEGTQLDPALIDFTSVFPLRVDGLLQVRMYFGAQNRPAYQRTYPATYVRVTGTRWTQVGGGSVDCSAGRAISGEHYSIPKASFSVKSARPAPVSAAQAAAASRSAAASQTAGHTRGTTGPSTGADGGRVPAAASPIADSTDRTADGSGATWWIVSSILLLVVVAAGLAIRRRTRVDHLD